MSSMDVESYEERSSGGGLAWFWVPVVLILFVGGALSVAAYFHESNLSIAEAIVAGFGGVAALIIGLFTAAFGVIVALIGALVGLVAAGGAVAMTLFIIGSPIIALILLFLLLRKPKCNECPDPSAH